MDAEQKIQRIQPAKLIFRFGAMGSAKSATAIMQAYNWKHRGRKVLCVKSIIDERTDTIWSRTGIECDCVSWDGMKRELAKTRDWDVVIVDECQFLTAKEVEFLANTVVDQYGISVYCYGLRTDFQSHVFEGSLRLFELADKLEQLETVCWCGNNAIMNTRIANGKIVRRGKQIVCGNEEYTSLCRKHYNEGLLALKN